MAPDAYMICTSPRSGSTLLCEMLAETNVAGLPASYFYRPSLEDWMERLGVEAQGASERDLIWNILRAAIAKGRGRTPVFGLRQQRPSFDFLCRKLAVAIPDAMTDRDRITAAFGNIVFIHLTREDKLAQAVSLIKAQQSGLWHVAPDGSEWERTAPHRHPTFDRQQIGDTVKLLTGYDEGWRSWFEQHHIAPIRITYDDLAADPRNTLRNLLVDLGISADNADRVQPQVRKMADGTSRDWISRYVAANRPSG